MSNFSFRNPNETVGQDEVIQERQRVMTPTVKVDVAEKTPETEEQNQWFEDVQANIKRAVSDFNAAGNNPEELEEIVKALRNYKIKVLGTFPGEPKGLYYNEARKLFNDAIHMMEFTLSGGKKTGMGIAGVVGLLGVAAGAYFIFK